MERAAMNSISERDLGNGCIKIASAERFHLVLHKDSGFFNPKLLCAEYNETRQPEEPEKQWTWYNGPRHKLEAALKHHFPMLTFKISVNRKSTDTYFHPVLMLDFALWVSPKVYAHTAAIIMAETFHEEVSRMSKAAALFPFERMAECVKIDAEHWRVTCEDIPLIVDKRGYFSSEYVDAIYNVMSIEKRPDTFHLIKYLEDRGLCDRSYYHPLLFLYWMARVEPDRHAKWACVIFGCSDERLRSLFRRAIQAAATDICAELESSESEQSNLKPDQPPVKSHVKFNRPLLTLNLITGKYSGSTTSDRNEVAHDPTMDSIGLIIGKYSGSTTSDKNKVSKPIGVDVQLALLECKLDEERTVKDKALIEKDDALFERDVALKQKQMKEEELERLRKQKQDSDEKYKNVLKQLAELQIDYKQKLRKFLHRPDGVTIATATVAKDPTDDRPVAKQECLVLFKLEKGDIYAIRGQLKYTLKAILKQLDNIVEFVGWYVCDNAVQVFNECKNNVEKKARTEGHDVHVKAGKMNVLDNPNAEEFDLPDYLCEVLRVKFDVYEADVRILGNLFKKPARSNKFVFPLDPMKADLIKSVHKYINDEYDKANPNRHNQ